MRCISREGGKGGGTGRERHGEIVDAGFKKERPGSRDERRRPAHIACLRGWRKTEAQEIRGGGIHEFAGSAHLVPHVREAEVLLLFAELHVPDWPKQELTKGAHEEKPGRALLALIFFYVNGDRAIDSRNPKSPDDKRRLLVSQQVHACR